MKKRLTILEYKNGFVMPYVKAGVAQGNGAFLKEEILMGLPDDVNEDDIEANYENGVLQLTIPKMKKSKAKKISVKSGKSGLVEKLSGKGKKKAVNH